MTAPLPLTRIEAAKHAPEVAAQMRAVLLRSLNASLLRAFNT